MKIEDLQAWVNTVPALVSAAVVVLEAFGIKMTDEQNKQIEALAQARSEEEQAKIDKAMAEAKARLSQGKEEPK
mgnify:CR=1 FL=1